MKKSKRSSPRFDAAISFLTNFLANDSKSYAEVSTAAEQCGIKPGTLNNAAKEMKINRSQRKGVIGYFWTLPTKPETSAFGDTRRRIGSFFTAYESAQVAGCLDNPLVAQLAEAAHLAIKEAERKKPSPNYPPSWPFPEIRFSRLTKKELIRMLGTVEDPLIAHLVKLLSSPNAKTEFEIETETKLENETETEYEEAHSKGYDEALSDVEAMHHAVEGDIECPDPSVTSVFDELNARMTKLRSEADDIDSHKKI